MILNFDENIQILFKLFYTIDPNFYLEHDFCRILPERYNPEIFWKDIPKIIQYGENILRIIVFLLPVIMLLSFKTKLQKTGLHIYLLDIILYFASWVAQIYLPESGWSKSMLGFLAPAYTTQIWLLGIGLIGNKTFFKIPHMYIIYIYIIVGIFCYISYLTCLCCFLKFLLKVFHQ